LNLVPGFQRLESLISDYRASSDGLANGCCGVAARVLGEPGESFLSALLDLLVVVAGIDEAELERAGVPVGGGFLEAADVVAAGFDVELRALGVDVDAKTGGGVLEHAAVGAEAAAVALGRPRHVVDDEDGAAGRVADLVFEQRDELFGP
jgi:hypothetical protein